MSRQLVMCSHLARDKPGDSKISEHYDQAVKIALHLAERLEAKLAISVLIIALRLLVFIVNAGVTLAGEHWDD